MLKALVAILNYSGTFAFALHGARLVAWDKPHAVLKALIASFLCSFGGGLTRDLIILGCTPAILKSSDTLTVMILTFIFYAGLRFFRLDHILEIYPVKYLLIIMDASGVAVFIDAGVDMALAHGTTGVTILFSGVITAIGGGIWGALLSGQHPLTVLRSAAGYRCIILAHTVFCMSGRALPGHMRGCFIVILTMSCVVCCCVLEKMTSVKLLPQNVFPMEYGKRMGTHLSSTTAQRFWSIVNPMRGRNENRVFFVYGGRRRLLRPVFAY